RRGSVARTPPLRAGAVPRFVACCFRARGPPGLGRRGCAVAESASGRRGLTVSGRLILARHGQTVANVARRLDTALPGAERTELGVEQARTLGKKLVERGPELLVASQALRARQTAEHAAPAVALETVIREGVHEVQVGELEDRSDEESHRLFMKVFEEWHHGD